MQQAAVGDLEAAAACVGVAQHRRQRPVAAQSGGQHVALHDEARHLYSHDSTLFSVECRCMKTLHVSEEPVLSPLSMLEQLLCFPTRG